jgi:hypothetical protein
LVAKQQHNLKKLLSYLAYSQTWLHPHVDGCQCGYTGKVEKKAVKDSKKTGL